IPGPSRNYKESYWRAKTFAPSCLIFYLGVKKKINRLGHHTLFFDEDIDRHAFEIYQSPQWPSNPLFYVCCPSRTDPTVAPEGHENLFLLMPVAAGLTDGEALRDTYYAMMMERLERFAGEPIRPFVEFKRSYSLDEFSADYNAYKGNAYGLANTWSQTAIWRPKIRNRQIRHFYYAGQLTVPGPGVPPAIISGKVAAALLHQSLSKS
ncbi:MAG TPA: hypothetical protein VJ508_17315, partial [Saprospiraceae bacterium]|nr:hypothetical protein [Saprospiraceae bacterium]